MSNAPSSPIAIRNPEAVGMRAHSARCVPVQCPQERPSSECPRRGQRMPSGWAPEARLPGGGSGTALALPAGMKRLDLALHLARLLASLVLLLTVGPLHPLLAAALAMGLYFASFAFTHDVAHGALR